MPDINNIDTIVNRIGYEIVESIKREKKDKTKYKNKIDKALGVLVNDGVYAYYVYVKSESESESESEKVKGIFIKNIKDLASIVNSEDTDINEQFFQTLSEDLNKLLFFRELLEKVLIYARYHAKAMEE